MLASADAAYAVGELAALGRTIVNPHLLIGPFVRREAVLSSRIEGTQADVADLYAYEAGRLSGLAATQSSDDVREVANYVEALEYGLARLASLPVSLRLMRELHGRLMQGVRGKHATPGEFRRSQNWIGRPGCSLNEAEYVPPPPDEVLAALDAFEKYLHTDDIQPRLVRLAFIHQQKVHLSGGSAPVDLGGGGVGFTERYFGATRRITISLAGECHGDWRSGRCSFARRCRAGPGCQRTSEALARSAGRVARTHHTCASASIDAGSD
ncbi:Fic/DOC family N-terminal domain-containing protein [Candidatus Amarolinea dominans]|uniref:Fic family protein n=1 Tax=Candidatus Amarolinea dominans TaxID=3140696 RepID=UPI0031CC471E